MLKFKQITTVMRKTCIIAIVIALFSFSSCSQYKYEQVDGDPTKTRIYTLDNGLKVYLSVNDEEPRITRPRPRVSPTTSST